MSDMQLNHLFPTATMGQGRVNINEGTVDEIPAIFFTYRETQMGICAISFANREALVMFKGYVDSLLENYVEPQ